MNDRRMKEALEAIARRGVPENTNLMPRIAAQLERRSPMTTLRTRPLVAILVALLILLALSGVAYAIGRSLGYIPGVGLIEQGGGIRVLKEPVSVTRDGVTVTVKNAILTSNKTDIGYFVSGVPRSAYPEGEVVTGCIAAPYLILPDGTKMDVTGNMPPIPADVNRATFILPCIFNTLPGAVPENWELPLQFVPAPPELTVIPVTEILPSPSPLPEANATVPPVNPLAITKVLDLGDHFVIMGEFRYDALGKNALTDGSAWSVKAITIVDANGREIPNSPTNDIEWPTPTEPNAETWLLRIPKNFIPPLTITYDVEHTSPVGAKEQAEFEFDAGQNPQAGDEWVVNKDFKLGGYNIRLVSIFYSDGYSFQFKADPGASANWLSVDIVGYTPTCGGGGGSGNDVPVEFTLHVCFWDPATAPKGKLKAVLNFQAVTREDRTFQIQWSPIETFVTPTPQADLCLTFDKWNQLAGREDALPVGVGGKVVTTVNEGAIYVSNLDGTNLQKIDTGARPSLSTDGTRLAYSASDGIRVRDLSSGQTTAIGLDGNRIIWSPDNTRIMFTTTFALYVANADGSGLRQVNTGAAQVISPTGWVDNQTIVYAAMSGEGFMFTTYNLQSGETKSLFTIQNKAGYGAISPDGGWIVFADRIVGEVNWGIFISRLDGSERRMIAEPQVPTAFMSVWGPDGQWLILNTQDAKGNRAVLVNPFNCQVFSLNHVNGAVEGWSP